MAFSSAFFAFSSTMYCLIFLCMRSAGMFFLDAAFRLSIDCRTFILTFVVMFSSSAFCWMAFSSSVAFFSAAFCWMAFSSAFFAFSLAVNCLIFLCMRSAYIFSLEESLAFRFSSYCLTCSSIVSFSFLAFLSRSSLNFLAAILPFLTTSLLIPKFCTFGACPTSFRLAIIACFSLFAAILVADNSAACSSDFCLLTALIALRCSRVAPVGMRRVFSGFFGGTLNGSSACLDSSTNMLFLRQVSRIFLIFFKLSSVKDWRESGWAFLPFCDLTSSKAVTDKHFVPLRAPAFAPHPLRALVVSPSFSTWSHGVTSCSYMLSVFTRTIFLPLHL